MDGIVLLSHMLANYNSFSIIFLLYCSFFCVGSAVLLYIVAEVRTTPPSYPSMHMPLSPGFSPIFLFLDLFPYCDCCQACWASQQSLRGVKLVCI